MDEEFKEPVFVTQAIQNINFDEESNTYELIYSGNLSVRATAKKLTAEEY